jgi:hypothetical protein
LYNDGIINKGGIEMILNFPYPFPYPDGQDTASLGLKKEIKGFDILQF